MPKISLITLHRIYNYGSVLQTYATQKLFEDAGAQCEIVDYISPHRAKVPLFLDCPPWLEGKKLKCLLYYVAKVPSFVLKDISFGGFIHNYLHLSKKKYITNEDILKNPPVADIYVSGSDQVWNSKYNHGVDGSYFLNFAPNGAKRAAFVSSFGRGELSAEERRQVKSLLQKYEVITVREDSALKILENMELEGTWLLDPTLQIERQYWMQLASTPLMKEKYLLLFLLYNEDNGATEYAKRVAEKKGLKLVKLSWEMIRPRGVDLLFTHRKPQDFLSLIGNADFVVTNSFHGVAFSVNLNRQFVFIPRSEFNGRIESLLRLTGLETRKVVNLDDYGVVQQPIDYTDVNGVLIKEREKAQQYIRRIVSLR